jgi:hypothetical protein
MVTPYDVSKSYIVAKVGGEGTFCPPIMPFGTTTGLPSSAIDLFKAWINAGAPPPGQGAGDAGVPSADPGGGDAGALDAGL